MSFERPYYRDLNCHPLLFYIIFGVKDQELKVSGEKHHVDGFPKGLDFVFYNREKNNSYMQSLLGGNIGKMLDREKHDLYKKVENTDNWAVIRGEIQQDENLSYMRNTIGFIQALIENDAIGVLDLQTFTLYSSQEWTNKFFEQEFNPYNHVTILSSEMEDGFMWLHTRGMRKFGRPDIGIEKVAVNEVENAVQVINQMIYYGSLGAFFDKEIKLHTYNGKAYIVKPEFVNDYENTDYNNSYYRFLWQECKCVE